MFGYILPEKPELKIKEYEIFRAYYCGVCKSIGDRFGQISRSSLNYDSAFLALLLDSIGGQDIKIKRERCFVHPLKRHLVARESKVIDYASDINIILAYYNLKDNWKDDKSVLAGMGVLYLRRAYRKLHNKYLKKCDIIEKKLDLLYNLEKERCLSIDKAAEPFAKLMEEVTAYEPFCQDDKLDKILRWIGYNLGKWIYILDAYDDIDKDIKRKTYNPVIYQFNYQGQNIEEFKKQIKERIKINLMYSLSEISKAYELLEKGNNAGILENIIYLGMLRKTEKILEKGSCR